MKYIVILVYGTLVAAFLSSALAQENEAEKLFRDLEKKLRTAKGFQVESTYQFGKRQAKVELLSTQENQARLKVTGHVEGDHKGAFEVVSDGKRLKSTGARLYVQPSGLPVVELGGPSEWPTPKNFHEVLSSITCRGGTWYSLQVLPYIARGDFGEKLDPDGEESKLRAYDFKLAGDEKVGKRDAKVVTYRFGDGRATPDNADITLWIDSRSLMPLKRTFVLKKDNVSVTETYHDCKLDPEVDAKVFELPK